MMSYVPSARLKLHHCMSVWFFIVFTEIQQARRVELLVVP